MSSIKNLILVFLISFSLWGCDAPTKGFVSSEKDDISTFQYTKQSGVAFGKQGVYCVYGIFEASGMKILPGRYLDYSGLYEYSILELLQKYPQLRTKEAIKAAAVQQIIFRNRGSSEYDPEDLAELELIGPST